MADGKALQATARHPNCTRRRSCRRPTPDAANLRVLERLPTPMLATAHRTLYTIPVAKHGLLGHADKTPLEIGTMLDDLTALADKSNIDTAALTNLAARLDIPNRPADTGCADRTERRRPEVRLKEVWNIRYCRNPHGPIDRPDRPQICTPVSIRTVRLWPVLEHRLPVYPDTGLGANLLDTANVHT
ncbi:hypothetical protein [Nocardia nepalensis]|uniref:hypothetical protein n=1 Tax=Nocardia nepalensis TaxID=3375448 RepID=UPI003B676E7B